MGRFGVFLPRRLNSRAAVRAAELGISKSELMQIALRAFLGSEDAARRKP